MKYKLAVSDHSGKLIIVIRLSDITSPALFPFSSEIKPGLRQRREAQGFDSNFSKGKRRYYVMEKNSVV